MKLDRPTWMLVFMGVVILPAILGQITTQPRVAVVGWVRAQANDVPHLTDWTEEAKLVAGSGSSGGYFGYSVSIDGQYAVVGAVGENDHSGAAYVFVRDGDTWTQQARLVAGDREAGDNFGYSVSIRGNTVLVGAMGDSDNGPNTGSAYVFVRDDGAWTQQAKLTAGDGAQGDHFGWRVSVGEDTALVGAIDDDDHGSSSGSAYVFVRDGETWTEEAKLTAADGVAGDQFGRGVALRGDYAAIAARRLSDENGDYSGAVYVFNRNRGMWHQQAKLTAGNGSNSDRFGFSVAIDEEYIAVGAIGDSDNGIFSGAAYVFVRDQDVWTMQAKLTPGDGAAWDRFGHSVALSGDTAIVGALGSDGSRADAGAAYAFLRSGDGWAEVAKLVAGDGDEQDEFGYSVSLSGRTAVIGAIGDDDNGDLSGSAYVFQGPAPAPTQTPTATATPITTPTATPAMPTATPTAPARLNYLPLVAR